MDRAFSGPGRRFVWLCSWSSSHRLWEERRGAESTNFRWLFSRQIVVPWLTGHWSSWLPESWPLPSLATSRRSKWNTQGGLVWQISWRHSTSKRITPDRYLLLVACHRKEDQERSKDHQLSLNWARQVPPETMILRPFLPHACCFFLDFQNSNSFYYLFAFLRTSIVLWYSFRLKQSSDMFVQSASRTWMRFLFSWYGSQIADMCLL